MLLPQGTSFSAAPRAYKHSSGSSSEKEAPHRYTNGVEGNSDHERIAGNKGEEKPFMHLKLESNGYISSARLIRVPLSYRCALGPLDK